MVVHFPQSKDERERERQGERDKDKPNKMESRVFCNLVTEVISHHFYHNLFIRAESLSPAHTQGEENTKGMGTRRDNWKLFWRLPTKKKVIFKGSI